MKPKHLCGVVAAWYVMFFVVVPGMCAQETPVPRHVGVTQDWSQRQIVFSRDALAQHPELLDQEPRIRQQAMQRWQAPNRGTFPDVDPLPNPQEKSGANRDWNISTLGSRLHTNMFPAKYSFNPGAAPDCTNDYVVFALPIAGVDGGQANLVAFNELYSGTSPVGLCGTAPNVYFAYNVTTVPGGKIVTSPVLSLDGTQIAFVETVPGTPGSSIFHVLTWTPNQGAIGAAVTPTSGQMTSLTLTSAATSTTSSPWVDYGSHTAYMGDDIGNVYQVTSVFNGTPALSSGNWPIMVSSNYHLTPPVLDSSRGLLMVGSLNGDLYQINTALGTVTGTLIVGLAGGTTSGIVAPPIVDVTNGTTFVVSANGGSSAVLVEANTASLSPPLAIAPIGVGSSGGTKLRLFQPAFNNAYYTGVGAGVVSLCGTGSGTDTSPWQYEFKFTGHTVNTSPSSSFQLSTDPTDRCTGWTEFFNPNVGHSPGTDFFFFGLTGDCETVLFGSTSGCVVAIGTNGLSVSYTTAAVNGGPSGIVVDNYSVDAQASSIYLTSLTANTAFKFTQNGLQ